MYKKIIQIIDEHVHNCFYIDQAEQDELDSLVEEEQIAGPSRRGARPIYGPHSWPQEDVHPQPQGEEDPRPQEDVHPQPQREEDTWPQEYVHLDKGLKKGGLTAAWPYYNGHRS